MNLTRDDVLALVENLLERPGELGCADTRRAGSAGAGTAGRTALWQRAGRRTRRMRPRNRALTTVETPAKLLAMNEKKIWIVEEGKYSNYHVVGVFSCRKNAKLIASKVDGSTVTSRILDPCVKELNEGLNPYLVWMKRDGEVERCERIDDISGCDLEGETYLWKRSKAPAYKGKNIADVLHSTIWARNEQHAIKIVNEKRAQMIANKWK